MYTSYKGPSFGEDQVPPLASAYGRHANPLSYPTGSFYHGSSAYEAAPSQFPVYESRKAPAITSYYPDRGSEGTQVFVCMQSSYDFNEASPLLMSLMFANRRCISTLNPLQHSGSSYQYVLTASAPAFATLGWNSSQIPLRMQLQDESGLDAGVINVGSFQYTDGADPSDPASTPEVRKRKPSAESAELKRVPPKRLSNQQLQPPPAETYTSSPYALGPAVAFSQAAQTTPMDATYDYLVPYERSQSHRDFRTDPGSQPRSQSQRLTLNPHPLMTTPSPRTSSWGSPYAPPDPSRKSPGLSATPASRISTLSSPSSSTNPPLIRTSTIQPPPGSPATIATGVTGAPFSPYGTYQHKATLQINGDLDSMADHWTPEEWSQKRRIVQFWRSQSGSTIHTNFDPVKPDERGPNSICISCILWEERRECFVTSVDTIYLLESLVGVQFKVDEKNRIRRNLEGFRPMTVSKGKADSENFFKVIMGFPTPKPRNIEKDVKVFPWKILAHALKRIISKYVRAGSAAGRCDDADGATVCRLLFHCQRVTCAPKHRVCAGGLIRRQHRSRPSLSTLAVGVDRVELLRHGNNTGGHFAQLITWTTIGTREFVRSARSACCGPQFESGLRGVILHARSIPPPSANQLATEPTPGDQSRSSRITRLCLLHRDEDEGWPAWRRARQSVFAPKLISRRQQP